MGNHESKDLYRIFPKAMRSKMMSTSEENEFRRDRLRRVKKKIKGKIYEETLYIKSTNSMFRKDPIKSSSLDFMERQSSFQDRYNFESISKDYIPSSPRVRTNRTVSRRHKRRPTTAHAISSTYQR